MYLIFRIYVRPDKKCSKTQMTKKVVLKLNMHTIVDSMVQWYNTPYRRGNDLVPNADISLTENDQKRQMTFSRVKRKNVNVTVEFCIFKLALVPNFSLNWQLIFFDPICPKWAFWVENRKSEHYCWVLHIRISVHTKFQLKLTTSSFWTWPNLT